MITTSEYRFGRLSIRCTVTVTMPDFHPPVPSKHA